MTNPEAVRVLQGGGELEYRWLVTLAVTTDTPPLTLGLG